MVAHWDVIITWAYNTQMLSPDRLPKGVSALTEPAWSSKFAMSGNSAFGFDTLAFEWGKDRTLDIATRIAVNRPIYSRNTLAVVTDVGTGVAPVGIGYASGVEAQKTTGAPVDWYPLEPDVVPVLPLGLYVPKGAPHPNVGRLFTAWLATDGMRIQEERESVGRISDPNYGLAKRFRSVAPNAKIAEAKTIQDARSQEAMVQALLPLFSAPR
jgi:iron(III) transport system substrate-binding protein